MITQRTDNTFPFFVQICLSSHALFQFRLNVIYGHTSKFVLTTLELVLILNEVFYFSYM